MTDPKPKRLVIKKDYEIGELTRLRRYKRDIEKTIITIGVIIKRHDPPLWDSHLGIKPHFPTYPIYEIIETSGAKRYMSWQQIEPIYLEDYVL